MIVDVHGHIGTGLRNGAPARRVSTYAGTCSVDVVLVSNRDAASVPAGSENRDETDANLECLAACRSNPRLAPVYWVRPGKVDSHVRAFAGALATEPFVGVTFAPAENGYDLLDAAVTPYFAALCGTNRPALICVNDTPGATPHRAYEAAERYPQLPVVLCVCGGDTSVRTAALDVACYAQRDQSANLYLDTSHASAAEIRSAVDVAGSERILFGSNALHSGDSHIPRHLGLLAELPRVLGSEISRQVTGENAIRLFGLGLKRHALL